MFTINKTAEIGDIVRFRDAGEQSTIWLVSSTSGPYGRLYGRALGIVYPSALSSQPEGLEVIIDGRQLKALLKNPKARYDTLRELVRY